MRGTWSGGTSRRRAGRIASPARPRPPRKTRRCSPGRSARAARRTGGRGDRPARVPGGLGEQPQQVQPVARREHLVGIGAVGHDRRVGGEQAHRERRAGAPRLVRSTGLNRVSLDAIGPREPADGAHVRRASVTEHGADVDVSSCSSPIVPVRDQSPSARERAGARRRPPGAIRSPGSYRRMSFSQSCTSRAGMRSPITQPETSNVVRSRLLPGVGLSRYEVRRRSPAAARETSVISISVT
jgi:hypothetical protein